MPVTGGRQDRKTDKGSKEGQRDRVRVSAGPGGRETQTHELTLLCAAWFRPQELSRTGSFFTGENQV